MYFLVSLVGMHMPRIIQSHEAPSFCLKIKLNSKLVIKHKQGLLKRIKCYAKRLHYRPPYLTNPEKFVSDYGSKVAEVVDKYDGQLLVRGGNVSYREGDPADLNVVVEFPSLEKAMDCINSPEYKAIEAGRKENMTGMFIVVEGV